jgi:hypothetical protein
MTDASNEPHAMPVAAAKWREGIPIIRRNEREIHIGDHAMPIPMSNAEVDWLMAITGAPSETDPCSPCPGGTIRAQRILNQAHLAGALAFSTECWWLSPRARASLQPHLLSLSEWHSDPQAAIAARTTWRVGVRGNGTVADAVQQLVTVSGLTAADQQNADITIVVGAHGIEAPEALLPLDMSSESWIGDRPHLPVSAYRGHASVGPLVIPGQTPCLNCLHQIRQDTDPDWPHLVQRWRDAKATTAVDADPLLAWQAAITAVGMVRAWIDAAPTQQPHRIHWRIPESVPVLEIVARHPACGCTWAPDALPRSIH